MRAFETFMGKKPHYRMTIVPVETVALITRLTQWVGHNWGLHQVARLEVSFDGIHDSNAAVGYKKGHKK